MDITNYSAKTVEALFEPFHLPIDLTAVDYASCIAYLDTGGDTMYAAYEVSLDHESHYFVVASSDSYQDEEASEARAFIEQWARVVDMTYVANAEDPDDDQLVHYLFEIPAPFGMTVL